MIATRKFKVPNNKNTRTINAFSESAVNSRHIAAPGTCTAALDTAQPPYLQHPGQKRTQQDAITTSTDIAYLVEPWAQPVLNPRSNCSLHIATAPGDRQLTLQAYHMFQQLTRTCMATRRTDFWKASLVRWWVGMHSTWGHHPRPPDAATQELTERARKKRRT